MELYRSGIWEGELLFQGKKRTIQLNLTFLGTEVVGKFFIKDCNETGNVSGTVGYTKPYRVSITFNFESENSITLEGNRENLNGGIFGLYCGYTFSIAYSGNIMIV
eukprot:TRINITY_DN5997_c0_g3_i4.p1 TRINITY_DN5997_c0_g3~~TRINITY_DN5997_c0_g3_i4.p1  ORF type:complete len:106 (+),score=34.09 TRINITY_DN5997_c0_g3_i4:89-406(+)